MTTVLNRGLTIREKSLSVFKGQRAIVDQYIMHTGSETKCFTR